MGRCGHNTCGSLDGYGRPACTDASPSDALSRGLPEAIAYQERVPEIDTHPASPGALETTPYFRTSVLFLPEAIRSGLVEAQAALLKHSGWHRRVADNNSLETEQDRFERLISLMTKQRAQESEKSWLPKRARTIQFVRHLAGELGKAVRPVAVRTRAG